MSVDAASSLWGHKRLRKYGAAHEGLQIGSYLANFEFFDLFVDSLLTPITKLHISATLSGKRYQITGLAYSLMLA